MQVLASTEESLAAVTVSALELFCLRLAAGSAMDASVCLNLMFLKKKKLFKESALYLNLNHNTGRLVKTSVQIYQGTPTRI